MDILRILRKKKTRNSRKICSIPLHGQSPPHPNPCPAPTPMKFAHKGDDGDGDGDEGVPTGIGRWRGWDGGVVIAGVGMGIGDMWITLSGGAPKQLDEVRMWLPRPDIREFVTSYIRQFVNFINSSIRQSLLPMGSFPSVYQFMDSSIRQFISASIRQFVNSSIRHFVNHFP